MIRLCFSLIFLFLFVAGCGTEYTPKVRAQIKALPSWINTPPKDDEAFIYGIGIDTDRQASINAALSDLLSRLGTTIESSYQSTQEVSGYYTKSETKNRIKADVAKIKVQGYELLQTEQLGYKEYATLLRVAKKQFAQSLAQDLERNRADIKQKQSALATQNTLVRYNSKKALSHRAKKMIPTLLVLKQLNPAFDSNTFFDFVATIQEEFIKEKEDLSFFVEGDAKAQPFVELVKNQLSHLGFTLSASKSKSVVVALRCRDNLGGSFVELAVLELHIKVYDAKQQLGGKKHILKEHYRGSIDTSYRKATSHFKADIQKSGISDILGISLDTK